MPFTENAAFFFDGPVQDYRGPADWKGPEYSYRLRAGEVPGAEKIIDALDSLSRHDEAPMLRSLVIGKWCDFGECSSATIIEALEQYKARFRGLVAIFLGDITIHEIKGRIYNSDISPLLYAYPKLEVLRVRGGRGLRFACVQPHYSLRALIIETCGMPRSVIADLGRCKLPNLVHLDLWLGAKKGGWDGSLDDLQELLDGSLFPSLKYLGLRNSEIADEIASSIVNKPVLHKLETLDLSNGNLSDRGGRALWGIMWDVPLNQLILNHHYMTPKIVRTLQMELRCKVLAEDAKNPNDAQRLIFATD